MLAGDVETEGAEIVFHSGLSSVWSVTKAATAVNSNEAQRFLLEKPVFLVSVSAANVPLTDTTRRFHMALQSRLAVCGQVHSGRVCNCTQVGSGARLH